MTNALETRFVCSWTSSFRMRILFPSSTKTHNLIAFSSKWQTTLATTKKIRITPYSQQVMKISNWKNSFGRKYFKF